MDDYLYLWPSYGSALVVTDHDLRRAQEARLPLAGSVAVVAGDHRDARRELLRALRVRAKQSYELLTRGTQSEPVDGWLVIDVPIPARIEPTEILHRMIRRLYYAAVLHGLGEVPAFRETVQTLRLAFLQTRGMVALGRDTEGVQKAGFELGGKIGASPEITAKLTAGDELKVVEKLNAQMARLDLFEAEDELTYDLAILQRLEMFADQYSAQIGEPGSVPRWEKVRGWFKQLYAPLHTRAGIRLRPAFVFEATSVVAVLGLARFFAQAASIANAHGAEIFILGGPELAAAIQADADLGGIVFRQRLTLQNLGGAPTPPTDAQKAFLATLADNPPANWNPEIVALAQGMRGILTAD